MKNIEYKIYNPGGNITALVIDNDYNQKEIIEINNYLLKKYPKVEQVAFLNVKNNELKMAGGEFCVNAARCAMYYLIKNLKINYFYFLNNKIEGILINKNKIMIKYFVNKNINEIYTETENIIVNLDKIILILTLDNSLEKNEITNKIKESKYNSEAIGLVMIEDYKINPYIWVRGIDTLYNETACGSASIATALYYYKKNKLKESKILQPSGKTIEVKLDIQNEILKNIEVSGYIEEIII